MKLRDLLRKCYNIQKVNISGCGKTWTGDVGSALASPTVPNENVEAVFAVDGVLNVYVRKDDAFQC